MATNTMNKNFLKLGNVFMSFFLRLGVPMWGSTILTVPGRKSGVPRATPVTITKSGNERWVVSVYGVGDWALNLRAAAGKATLTNGSKVEQVIMEELPPKEAAPMLKRLLAKAPGMIKAQFKIAPDAPVEEFERIVPNHPVFRVKHVSGNR